MGLVVAVLLGLRHATDPDHLTAVSTLVLSEERGGARQAGILGFAWGLGTARRSSRSGFRSSSFARTCRTESRGWLRRSLGW